MTDTELSDLEYLAREATPGPWRYKAETDCEPPFETAFVYVADVYGSDTICLLDGDKRTPGRVAKDAAYIAAANPKTVLWLLAERRIAKNEIKRVKDKICSLELSYARLEKEADWLAQTAANNWQGRDVSSVYMREQARRAVRGMGND